MRENVERLKHEIEELERQIAAHPFESLFDRKRSDQLYHKLKKKRKELAEAENLLSGTPPELPFGGAVEPPDDEMLLPEAHHEDDLLTVTSAIPARIEPRPAPKPIVEPAPKSQPVAARKVAPIDKGKSSATTKTKAHAKPKPAAKTKPKPSKSKAKAKPKSKPKGKSSSKTGKKKSK